jgi:hypothetical protein
MIPRSSPRRLDSHGYTAVEVLMSLSVLAVGVIGIFSMEKVTVASNSHAKNLAIATHIGQSWLGRLEAEATLWDATPLARATRTQWLAAAPAQPIWFRPAFIAASQFGPDFDELGNPVAQNGKFCVDLRLSPLSAAESEGSAIWRTEVRVYWLRDGAIPSTLLTSVASPCNLLTVNVSLQPASQQLHFVYLSGAVRQVVP